MKFPISPAACPLQDDGNVFGVIVPVHVEEDDDDVELEVVVVGVVVVVVYPVYGVTDPVYGNVLLELVALVAGDVVALETKIATAT